MASLPPRPESPLRMPLREDRRHPPDDRDRDRRSAAQPMASRFRDDRFPERDRSYVPRPRLDTYIAPGFEGRRDPDRRDFDSDRERARRELDRENRERDRRNWERQQREREQRERERDRDRSPPRRHSPDRDRDRRPFERDRGPPRRPLSPVRRPGKTFAQDYNLNKSNFPPPGPRRSRSPPRRRFSRSPPPPHFRPRNRSRSRSRSPHRSPPPLRRIRLGHHSIGASPRSRTSRSPHRRPASRDRTPLSPSRREGFRRPSVPREPDQTDVRAPPAPSRQDATMDGAPAEQSANLAHAKLEDPSSTSLVSQPPSAYSSNQAELSTPYTRVPETHHAATTALPGQNKNYREPAEPTRQITEHSQRQSEINHQTGMTGFSPKPAPVFAKTEEMVDVKMDYIESPKPSAPASNKSVGSDSPKPSPVISDGRGPPAGPRWASGRSPPRGPRNHTWPPQTSQTSSAPRGPRRDYRGPPYNTSKSGPSLPHIPRYIKPPNTYLHDLETELARIQHHRSNLAVEHVQVMKAARKALQDFDIATIDLQAAESRRRMADLQLEKAKSGSLGIDASPADFEP